ncbi:inositol monophosphatase [Oleiharenicola lentus]|uniref:Inositol monophosphatase n=1 Tax=Oleiharenicola lentus TaxID=2508720 RepID=A0A4Q1C9X7_9BACT|nr:inositol monophosphatase [Oleiharenicola lentus]RXK55853.1 inositol monophosphatase [Oleiharenicola lentus]
MTNRELDHARHLLCRLQDHIRESVIAAWQRQGRSFAKVVAVTAADTIYQVDRIGEQAILEWFERHWPKTWPVELVMEGLDEAEAVTFPAGTPVGQTRWKCILDPIDGTRGLMYDKRSAWSLAGLAPQRGGKTTLADIVVAAMTELPTSKQWRADQLSAVKGRGVVAQAVNVLTGERKPLRVTPSRAKDCRGGFAALSRFFPEGKALLGELEERLWQELYGRGGANSPLVFDDQYICSGGQLAELIAGHDRFMADLRPRVFGKLHVKSALVCHPYDLCTALVAREAGCVIEAPLGGAIRAPLDTTSAVDWAGYANPALARHIRPVLRRLIKRML